MEPVLLTKNIVVSSSICIGHSLVSNILLGNAELIGLEGLWKPTANCCRFVVLRYSSNFGNSGDVDCK